MCRQQKHCDHRLGMHCRSKADLSRLPPHLELLQEAVSLEDALLASHTAHIDDAPAFAHEGRHCFADPPGAVKVGVQGFLSLFGSKDIALGSDAWLCRIRFGFLNIWDMQGASVSNAVLTCIVNHYAQAAAKFFLCPACKGVH